MGVIVSGRCVDRHLPGGLEERTGCYRRARDRLNVVVTSRYYCANTILVKKMLHFFDA
jgi:hypothetical protein